jgi:UDP-N-acetyl-D-glucosamine dehydrogenase
MPDFLHLQPQEVDTFEKRGEYKVCVIGCGLQGVQYAVAFVQAGFKVFGVDADQSLIKRLSKGKLAFSERGLDSRLKGYLRAGILTFTSDVKGVAAKSDVIILATNFKIDEKKTSDFSEVENLCKQFGSVIQRDVLVIYGGMTSYGFTEGVIKEKLENTSGLKAGVSLGLAYIHCQTIEKESQIEKGNDCEWIVAADDKTSLDAASLLFSIITKKNPKKIMSSKVAEMVMLFTFARREVTIALTNELAVLCEKAGVDYFETLQLMKPLLQASESTPTIAEEGEKTEIYSLLESAENLGVKLRFPELAIRINEGMVRHAISLTQDALRSCGKTLRRSRIAVLGDKRPGTSGESFVKMLEAKGARINLYGTASGKSDLSEMNLIPKKTVNEAVESSDCIIILNSEDQFKRLNLKALHLLMKTQAAIVDLGGLFEPGIVENEGFIYRGLGRGNVKK